MIGQILENIRNFMLMEFGRKRTLEYRSSEGSLH